MLIFKFQPYEEIIETMPFKPASRVTEAGEYHIRSICLFYRNELANCIALDEKNDRRSPERRLQDSLYLIVKRNRSDHVWQFPQGKILAEETCRGVSKNDFLFSTEKHFIAHSISIILIQCCFKVYI